jgi:hypothetical protein
MIPSGRGQKWQRPSGKTGLWVPGILVLNYLLGYYFFVGSEAIVKISCTLFKEQVIK